jgi:hypothetical protein
VQISTAPTKTAAKIDNVFREEDAARIFTRRKIAWFFLRETGFAIGLEKAAF